MTKTIKRPAIKPPPLPEIDDATRREFLIGAAGILLLPAGCGGGESGGANSGEATAKTRTVESVYGRTRVPAEPERIVTLDPVTLLDVLALGFEPVGYVQANLTGLGIVEDRLEGIEAVGTESQPNLEAIAALEPDLIFGYTENPEEMGQIAPVVDVPYDETEWKRMLRDKAKILGRRKRAEELLSDFETRKEEFRGAMGERLDEVTVSFVRFSESGVSLYPGSFSSSVMADVGLRMPPEQRLDAGECCVELSAEKIPEIDADYVFVAVDPGGEEKLREYESNPLWERLEGEKVAVDSSVWIQPSYLTAKAILDDLEEHVLEGGERT
jgi:iron complex transport system substrate-binding protein